MQENQVAVLIDGDNISPKYAEYIKQEATRIGRIKISRLYGSINSPSVKSWYSVLPKYGITPMLQICYTKGKSIADQALTIDAMDILYSGEVDTICLVTSDSDFTKLAYRIKESGKMLIGMGEQKTNESLAQACDEFKVLDLIYQIDDSGEQEEDVPIEETEDDTEEEDTADIEFEDVKAISIPTVEEIVDMISNKLDDEWDNLATVGTYLSKQIPGFDVRNYGYKNMRQLIENHKARFEIKSEVAKDGIHRVFYARMRTE
ncbi:MAG: NYN domain-containing protein [Lachnospiraceae bacterium]|nr:NYN domain-containing protein [Lachnospiraceae bacterium]